MMMIRHDSFIILDNVYFDVQYELDLLFNKVARKCLEKNDKQYNMKNKKIIDNQKIETRKYISNVWPNYCMALL